MSRDKEVDEVVSKIIFLVNNQYSCLVQLLGVLTMILARKMLLKKRLLLLMSSESTTKNGKKESRRSPPRFWVRPHRNLKWWNNFMNGNMIPEEWKENFRMSERSFYILCEELRPYIQKETTRFRKPISVEKQQVASTLYYLSDEGRMRKVANAFGIGKSTASRIIRRVTQAISKF